MKIAMLAAASALLVAGCSSAPMKSEQAGMKDQSMPAKPVMATTSTVQSATANMGSASGSLVSGRLTLVPMGDGVHLTGELGGFNPGGAHAIHIHENGDCSAADATSAGGHFNPAGQPHGKVDSGPHHAGDMNNFVADTNGVVQIDAHAQGVVMGGGAANDIIGKAVVVHAKGDDYTSQPSGNAGDRIACGVINAGG